MCAPLAGCAAMRGTHLYSIDQKIELLIVGVLGLGKFDFTGSSIFPTADCRDSEFNGLGATGCDIVFRNVGCEQIACAGSKCHIGDCTIHCACAVLVAIEFDIDCKLDAKSLLRGNNELIF